MSEKIYFGRKLRHHKLQLRKWY